MTEASHLLHSLGEIASIVHEGKDPQDVLERMAFAICLNSPWQSSSIMAIDTEAQTSIQVANFSRSVSDKTLPRSWPLTISPTADVLSTGKPVIIADALNDKHYLGYWQAARVEHYRTVVVLPLRVRDDLGRPMAISLQATEIVDVSETMLQYLSTIADFAGMALEKGQRLAAERAVGVRLESILELQRSIVTQAFKESSLDALLPLCRRHLPYPFIIVDLVSGHAHCGGFGNDRALSEALNGAGWRQIEKLFRDAVPSRFEVPGRIELRLGDRLEGMELFAEPILAGGQTIGGIAVASAARLGDDIIRTAESIWMALSIALMRHHIVRDAGVRANSRYLADLLEGRFDLLPRGDDMKLPVMRQPHRVLALRTERSGTPANTLLWALARLAETAQLRVSHGVVGSFVVFMVPEVADMRDEARLFGERLLAEAKRAAGKGVVMVESSVCADVSAYPVVWRQIIRISDWALERGRYGRISTVDSGAFGVLAGILDYSLAEDFCRSVLNAVREHDCRNSTPLLPTLASLIRHGGRLQSAADEIGVHVTTVRYRVERLRELFDLDLRDGDTRFTLDMALRLDAMLTDDQAQGY